jgi:hypothetical protein
MARTPFTAFGLHLPAIWRTLASSRLSFKECLMTRSALVLLLIVCLVPPAFAQSRGQAPADQISGTWTDGGSRGLELKFDGKKTLTGTLDPGSPGPVPFKDGTFDPKTGVFEIHAERTVNGATQTMVIEGKLADGKLTGTYEAGSNKGTFTFTKKAK